MIFYLIVITLMISLDHHFTPTCDKTIVLFVCTLVSYFDMYINSNSIQLYVLG